MYGGVELLSEALRRLRASPLRFIRVSPEAAYAVPIEEGFIGYENEVVCLSLGDEHPVERVLMGTRHHTGPGGVGYGYREFAKILPGDSFLNV